MTGNSKAGLSGFRYQKKTLLSLSQLHMEDSALPQLRQKRGAANVSLCYTLLSLFVALLYSQRVCFAATLFRLAVLYERSVHGMGDRVATVEAK